MLSSGKIRRLAKLTRRQERELVQENKRLLKSWVRKMDAIIQRETADWDIEFKFQRLNPWDGGDGGQYRWTARSRNWFGGVPSTGYYDYLGKAVNELVWEDGYAFGGASLHSGVMYLVVKKDPKAFEQWAEGEDPLLVDALREMQEAGIW